jgi:hypothetical protein
MPFGGCLEVFIQLIELIKAVVWPITTVIVVLVLKSDFSTLLRNIKSLRHKETEISFEDKVHSVTEGTYVGDIEEGAAEFSPRGVIIESWLNIESALNDYTVRHGNEVSDKPFTNKKFHWHMFEYDSLGKGTLEMLHKLRLLRNEAVHMQESSLTANSAKEYTKLADKVLSVIEQA